jgi:hypothetical protein
VIRRPRALPDSEWEETFTVIEVRDAYRHPDRGRVLEFFTESHQSRTVAITDIELNAGTIRRLKRENIAYR